jgi:hypothetical protein
MAFTIDGTNGLTFNNATTQNSGGKILQVTTATSTSSFSTSSGSFVTTGISASITPLFATSKILVTFSAYNMVQTGNMAPSLTVYRNATALDTTGFAQLYAASGTTTGAASGVYLDSPATTSSTAYTLYFRNQNNNGSVTLNSSNGLISIVLMEVAA